MTFRGARDDNSDDETLQGKFQALLAIRVDSGDKTLRIPLEMRPTVRRPSRTILSTLLVATF